MIGKLERNLYWYEIEVLLSISIGEYQARREERGEISMAQENSLCAAGLIRPGKAGWQLTEEGHAWVTKLNEGGMLRAPGTEGRIKVTFTDPDGVEWEYEGQLAPGSAVQIHHQSGSRSTIVETDFESGQVVGLGRRKILCIGRPVSETEPVRAPE